MRNIPGASLAKIAQRFGAEPICVVGVYWGPGEFFYADKLFYRGGIPVEGLVLSINNVEDVTTLAGSTNSTNLTIVFDDTDGAMKRVFDTIDIHKRRVTVYQYFEGLDFNSKFTLYEGVIESPIIYSDNDRTLSISVVSVNEHQEAGFSPEEGQFPNLPSSTVGQAWPMVFGAPLHSPGLTYQYPPIGTLLNPFYVVDPSLDVFDVQPGGTFLSGDSSNGGTSGRITATAIPRENYGADGEIVATPQFRSAEDVIAYSQAIFETNAAASKGMSFSSHQATIEESLSSSQAALKQALDQRPPPGQSSFIIDGQEYDEHDYELQITTVFGSPPVTDTLSNSALFPQQNQSAYARLNEVRAELEGKKASKLGAFLLNGGIGFPINTPMTLKMNNHVFEGTLGLDGFLTLKELKLPHAVPAYYRASGTTASFASDTAGSGTYQSQVVKDTTYFVPDGSYTPAEYKKHKPKFTSLGEANPGWKLQQGLQSDGFQLYDAGTQITVIGDYSVDYIVSIFPVAITQVWGYKAVGNTKVLAPVPKDRWQATLVQFGPIAAFVVRLNRLLSAYPGEGWQDGIYADLVSSVGPNPVDIMQTLIEVYTPDMTFDTESFNTARAQLANYPMNFTLSEKPEILNFLEDIAYQCRCAIYVKNRVFYLKYLSMTPDPDDTIGRDDVLEGSIVVTTSETEQLITRYTGTYQGDYATGITSSVIVRNNVAKYGLFKESHDFFAYTNPQYVEKTATYWTIIRSNVWKRLKFSTPLNKLNLETFDTILFNIPGVVADGAVACRIESTQYDSVKNQIDFECWVPVRLGEMTEYNFAFPADSETMYSPLFLREFDATVFQDFRQGALGILPTVIGQSPNNPIGGGIDSQPSSSDGSTQGFNPTTGLPSTKDTGEPKPTDRDDAIAAQPSAPEELVPPLELPNFGAEAPSPPDGELFGRRKPLKLNTFPLPACVPGRVMGPGEDPGVYIVEIWPQGMEVKSLAVACQQMQILESETIPSGTWVTVSRVCINKTGGENGITTEYAHFMQVPVWLGQLETPPTGGTIVDGEVVEP